MRARRFLPLLAILLIGSVLPAHQAGAHGTVHRITGLGPITGGQFLGATLEINAFAAAQSPGPVGRGSGIATLDTFGGTPGVPEYRIVLYDVRVSNLFTPPNHFGHFMVALGVGFGGTPAGVKFFEICINEHFPSDLAGISTEAFSCHLSEVSPVSFFITDVL